MIAESSQCLGMLWFIFHVERRDLFAHGKSTIAEMIARSFDAFDINENSKKTYDLNLIWSKRIKMIAEFISVITPGILEAASRNSPYLILISEKANVHKEKDASDLKLEPWHWW